MRSLHVITTDARRGAETFAVELTGALRDRGEDARVVALTGNGSPGHAVPTLGPGRRSPTTLTTLRRRATGAEVVVAHGSATLEACAVALAGTGRPFVYRSIGDPGYWIEPALRHRAVRLLLRRAARVVALWPDAARRLAEQHGLDHARLDVIPNAVGEERFPTAEEAERHRARRRFGIEPTVPCFAFVGALSAEKNVGTAIDTLRALPDAHLLVAGTGPLERPLRAHAETVGPDRVHFLGAVDEVRDVYAAADLLLLPSRSEGMPAVVIEAALVGTPAVATCVGALPTMIDDDRTGFLAPADDPAAFTGRVSRAVDRAPEVGRQAGRAFRGAYGLGPVAERWCATLRRASER